MSPKPLSAMKRIRLELRHDRCKVADRIEVSDRTLRNWEEGESSPTIEAAIKLATIYGVTLDQLAGRAPLPADPAA